jgi:hypothetical protein
MRVGLLLAVLLSCGASASAQDPESQPSESAAPSLPEGEELAALLAGMTAAEPAYELGVRLFQAQRYEDAERAWLRAYAIGRDPTLLVAVADTRQRRDDAPEAVAMLEQYLAERPDAPDQASIEARIATLLESPARLVIRSVEPGHAILLDGTPAEQKTPATIEVEPGSHTVVVVGNGRQVGEQTVQVGYGEIRELDFSSETKTDVIVEQSEEEKKLSAAEILEEDQTIRRAVISTGAIAGAALITGTALGIVALRKEQDYRDNPSASTADQGERIALFADLSFGLAALSAITSFTLFMTHRNKRKREKDLARFHVEPRGAGASATLRF